MLLINFNNILNVFIFIFYIIIIIFFLCQYCFINFYFSLAKAIFILKVIKWKWAIGK